MTRFLIMMLSMFMLAGTVMAQSQPIKPAAPTQSAPSQSTIEPNVLRDAGLRVARAVDAGKEMDLWDGSSPVMKKAVKREEFVSSVRNTRNPLGPVVSRSWVSIDLQQMSGQGFPPGQYATARSVASFAAGRSLTEIVTFRLDEDGTWRFAGYVIR
ncbi:DUF4019 domain-containing protein [Lysobacter sp. FW306-1B-D06B]|uniref:DUF4019 domain-containing protein n=1 Tax=Lysobacter sp. FW306-1B-D06B TaxID=3140250 RepID=UPI0031401ED2